MTENSETLVSQVVLIPNQLFEKIARQTSPCSSLVYENICQKSKFRGREENNFEFEFENDYIPDTDSVAEKTKIFEENIFDAATAVEVKEKEADELELDEGTKSNKNNLKDLFINEC